VLDLIPKAIAREVAKLVRDRDRWKRKALDRAADRSPERRRDIANRDRAVEHMLHMVWLYGLPSGRGAGGEFYEALKALRPDVAEVYYEEGGSSGARTAQLRFFPTADDLADEAREAKDDR
jgi:hypothetical protein